MTPEVKAMEALTSLPETKEQVTTFTNAILSGVIDGDINPLDVARQLKILAEITKGINDNADYKRILLDEATKYSQKEFGYKGATFTIKEVGTRYDYKTCGYSKYDEVVTKKASIEKMLRSIQGSMVDPDTGEEIFGAVKRSTTTVQIKL